MGLWDKVKALFRGGAETSVPADVAPSVSTRATPGAAAGATRDPYALGTLAPLSADEVRAQAGSLRLGWSAWTFRRDVIPPLADARTALLDRTLVLRGLASEDELRALHAIGDEHLRHHDAAAFTAAFTGKAGADAVAALRAERAQKKAEKQAEARRRRDERAAAIAHRKQTDIVYLGRGVSGALGKRTATRDGALATPADVARHLGVELRALRGLAFHADAAARVHYVHFDVPKKSGGVRRLAAPLPRLADAQRKIFDTLLVDAHGEGKRVHAAAHGFVRARSTVTNATPHQKQDLVVNLDLVDFFPTITCARVKGIFMTLGHSPAAATVLALLCTECPRVAVEHGSRKLHVAVGPRALPQGACTSPALSNLVCRRLDQRLRGIALGLKLTYTRYADDLTFSGPALSAQKLAHLLTTVDVIARAEGFTVHEKKTRVMKKHTRQEVTGIVVNAGPRVPREEVRRLRAILNEAGKLGLAEANRDGRPDFSQWLRGKLAYVAMVDPIKGQAMLDALDAIEAR